MRTVEHAVVLVAELGDDDRSVGSSPSFSGDTRQRLVAIRRAIAGTGGTDVRASGERVVAVFRSASVAMSCAVLLQQQAAGAEHAGSEGSQLRVGLSGGEVISEDGRSTGDPLLEAAALCRKCPAAHILAADVVRAMAGRRSPHKCTPLGVVSVQSIDDPVMAVDVDWAVPVNPALPRVPFPARLMALAATSVVGREEEMEVIRNSMKRVAGGDKGEVLLVYGEAGVGKTTLVAAAAKSAFDAGSCVLFGHCEEEMATPYQLFAEALGHYVGRASEDELRDHVRIHGSELARLTPALVRRLSDLPPSRATDADTERYMLLAAAVGIVATIAERRPLILVLDDIQWADEGSLQLLKHLASSGLPFPALVIGIYRDSDLAFSQELLETLGALQRQGEMVRIKLTGLDGGGVATLVERTIGGSLGKAGDVLARALFRETDGNPFFVVEVLRHLTEIGSVHLDAKGQWSEPATLEETDFPSSVREVIGSRVARMGRDAERVLGLAAVIGREFDLDLLSLASDLPENALLDLMDVAAAAALVQELSDKPGRYVFAHALIQHTLYSDLGPTRRARAHRAVGEALEELCGDRRASRTGELARHWSNATESVEMGKAIDYSRRAADAALDALAPGDALRYYRQALDLCMQAQSADPILVLDLTIGLGTAQRHTGDPSYRQTLLGAARRAADLGDRERLVAAALANDRGMVSAAGSVDREKVEVLETALSQLPHGHTRALVLAHLCQELIYGASLERRRSLAEEAVTIARSQGDDAAIVRVLNHISNPLRVPELQEASLAWSGDALIRAERVGDPVLLFWAANKRHTVAACAGDIEEMDRCLETVVSLSRRLDQPMLSWVCAYELASRALMAGDIERAEQLAKEACRIGTAGGQPDTIVIFGTQILFSAWERGTVSDLVPSIERTVADNPGIPAFGAALAMAHATADRFEDARCLLERFAASGFDLPMNMQWLTGMCGYAEAAIIGRQVTYAAPLFERLVPWADRFCYFDAGALGPVSLYLGGLASILGRFDAADDYLARAATFSERVGAGFFESRALLWWGSMLLDRRSPGDAGQAHDRLEKARWIATQNGYGDVERRAARLLQPIDVEW